MKERVQKIIAERGVCSRRAAEKLIAEGRVKVNGRKIILGASCDTKNDLITIDGKRIAGKRQKDVYLLAYKPRGYVTTASDDRGRKTVMELLQDVEERVYPVGRLDMASEGLLLLTNDGALLDAVSALLTEYIDGLAADNAALTARFRYQFLRLRDTLTLILRHIGDEFGQSCFTAVGLEVPVGEGGEVVPADLEAPDGTKVSLVGKIDRVDRYEDAAGSYIRVVDYKSGGKKFELSDVSFGLNMQMLIYLFAVCADRSGHFTGSEPAGILYMPGSLSPVSAAGDAAREEALRPELEKELTMNGLLLDDEQILRAMERGLDGKYIPVTARDSGELKAAAGTLSSREGFKRLRDTVQGHIREMARALRAGEISPRPFRKGKKTACDWCDYGRLCGNCGGPVFRDVRGGEEESHG